MWIANAPNLTSPQKGMYMSDIYCVENSKCAIIYEALKCKSTSEVCVFTLRPGIVVWYFWQGQDTSLHAFLVFPRLFFLIPHCACI